MRTWRFFVTGAALCASMAALAAESAPGKIKVTTRKCDQHLSLNLNASVAMEDYRQENSRYQNSYVLKLGLNYEALFKDHARKMNWMDVGAGYGLAPLQKIADKSNALICCETEWSKLPLPLN